jgi:hypothetical protein
MLGVETPSRCCRDHSACCAAVMEGISPSYRYNLSTPLAEDAGSMSRSMATIAMFWLALVKARSYPRPPPLVAGSRAASLA